MKIAIIGYGRMGKEVETIAVERGHEIVLKLNEDNMHDFTTENLQKADVAIEFTFPDSVRENVLKCFDANLPIVSGTTGWNEIMKDIIHKCENEDKTLFHASNFSLGVNLFFKMNEIIAKMMNTQAGYDISMEEIHHIHKKDKPSGTGKLLRDLIRGQRKDLEDAVINIAVGIRWPVVKYFNVRKKKMLQKNVYILRKIFVSIYRSNYKY